MVNGAFFDNEKSPSIPISFPFTPKNDIWRDSNHTKTLCISNNNAIVFDNGYDKKSFSKYCDYSLTLLHPKLDFHRSFDIRRTYFGVINSKNNSKGRFIGIFVGEIKDQNQMETILSEWKVDYKDILMGDGSSSAQFISNKFSLYGTKCVGGFLGKDCYKRELSHVVAIYPK